MEFSTRLQIVELALRTWSSSSRTRRFKNLFSSSKVILFDEFPIIEEIAIDASAYNSIDVKILEYRYIGISSMTFLTNEYII